MQLIRNKVFLSPDTGGEAGSGTGSQEPGQTEDQKTIEGLNARIKELEDEKKASEAKANAEKKARMSEEEKSKAEIDEMRKSLFEEHVNLQLKSAGLEEEFKPLFTGATVEEIKGKGELIGKLIANVKAATEADVKKAIAKTGAPGSGTENVEMSAEDYYASLMAH